MDNKQIIKGKTFEYVSFITQISSKLAPLIRIQSIVLIAVKLFGLQVHDPFTL